MAAEEEKEFSLPSLTEEERIEVSATDEDTKNDQPTYSDFLLSYISSDDDRPIGTLCRTSDSDSEEDYSMGWDGNRHMTEVEEAEYKRQVKESKGFDFEWLEGVIYGPVEPVSTICLETLPLYENVAKNALKLHQVDGGGSFELVKIVKTNREYIAPGSVRYYFTLLLKDEAGAERIYRVKVDQIRPNNAKVLCFELEVSTQECSSGKSNSTTCNSGTSNVMDWITGASKGDDGDKTRGTHKRPFEAID